MSLFRIIGDTTTTLTAAQIADTLGVKPLGREAADGLSNYFKALAGGVRSASVVVLAGSVKATGLVTFTGAPVANETVTIANVVFTAKASGATGNQFNIGGSITLTAAALAAAVNASSNLAGIVTATSAVGVVTLTAVAPGVIGNGLALSETLTNSTVTAFASGSDGTSYTISLA
jgi:hypothetical protein